MQAGDVASAASLHCRVFPDYFLTHMGEGFLQRFYREFVGRPGNYGFVAIRQDRPIGAVIGTTNVGAFYSQFYSHNLVAVTGTFLKRLGQDPYIRRNCLAKMGHIRHALAAAGRRLLGQTPAAAPATAPAWGSLLSIGVDPDFAGQGIAEELVDRLCERLWQDGVDAVELTVRADNRRAIAFYVKTGWQRVEATDTTIQYLRPTHANHNAGSGQDV